MLNHTQIQEEVSEALREAEEALISAADQVEETIIDFLKRLGQEEHPIEEMVSSALHALGLILSIIGIVYLLKKILPKDSRLTFGYDRYDVLSILVCTF
jgi:predicted membrane channel-forming protein YqfA (hemolysin III family)